MEYDKTGMSAKVKIVPRNDITELVAGLMAYILDAKKLSVGERFI